MSTLYEQMTHAQLVAALTALQRAAQASAPGAPLPSPAEAERLIRDLHARQLELERQNRELHEARQALEVSHGRCTQLNRFATPGFSTLDPAQPTVALDPTHSQAATTQHLLNTQEAERRRIARVLHDEIGQALTALKFTLQLAHDDPELARSSGTLDEGVSIIAQLLQQVRTLALDLRPSVLDDLGLVAALREYLDRQAQRGRLRATFGVEGCRARRLESARLPEAVEIACFRVAQEALTNVLRHAHARHVAVVLRADADTVTLLIQDDGVGFDMAAAQARAIAGGSIGLLGMQEQVALAGGQFTSSSAPGSGTHIQIQFPLAPDIILADVREPANSVRP